MDTDLRPPRRECIGDAGDWAAGAHDALCITYAGEAAVGTTASGALRYLDETLAVYREGERSDIHLVSVADGARIAFTTNMAGNFDVGIMNADGTEQSELTGLAPVGLAMFAPVPAE